MSESIEEEKIAYISPAETPWCVAVRDGTGLPDGLFTVQQRNYYDTVEEAHEAAERRLEGGSVDEVQLSVIAELFLEE